MADYPAAVTNYATAPTSGALGATSPTQSELHDLHRAEIIATQTELGVNPAGDFTDVAGRLDALDAPVFYVDSFAGANDTVKINAAIAAAGAAGGGVVQFADRVYTVAGALQDTSGANAQIVLPDVHMLDDAQIGIELRGAFPQSAVNSVVGAAVTPTTGTILKSTLAAGSGAVIGAYGSGTSFQHFTFVHLTIRNLTVRTVSNPTISGVDLRHVDSCTLDRVVVDTGQYDTALTEPTTATSFGLRLPKIDNGANINLNQVSVFGFYNGLEHSEHASLSDVAVGATKVAITATAANHASHYRRVLLGYYAVGLKFTGTHYLDVDQWACEHATSGWMATTADVSDASNYGHGAIAYAPVAQGGPSATFTKSGGANITAYRVGSLPAGGGSTLYVGRDRIIAAAGDGTLTLGASPVAGSPLVWIDGTLYWPGVDYTITDDVIAFGSTLAGGEVVTVWYQSTASPGASSLSGVSVDIQDDFNRANSSSSLGVTSVGSKTWTGHTGTWGISGNNAYVSSGYSGVVCRATIDAGVSNCTVAVKYAPGGSAAPSGLVVRADGSGNYYLIEVVGGTSYAPKIYKGVANSNSVIATGAATTVASGSVISVELSGDTITVKDDGVTIVSVTDSSYSSNTRHGLYTQASTGMTTGVRFDDFSVTS